MIILDRELEIAKTAMKWFLDTMFGCVIAVDLMGAVKRLIEHEKAEDQSRPLDD
jgi:hypothetical protein